MKLTSSILSGIRSWRNYRQLSSIYRKYRDFTMIPEATYIQNLEIASMARDLPGSVIECGVWRGGMSAGLCEVLGPQRKYYLFDSFEGLPQAKDIDGESAQAWQKEKDSPTYYNNCSAPADYARMAMELAGSTSFHLKKGWFEDTIIQFKPDEPIALLRLDGDWYDSTMVCLDNLFDQLTSGGILILDDYFAWDGCCKALHDFLSHRSSTERILTSGGVCHLIKRPH